MARVRAAILATALLTIGSLLPGSGSAVVLEQIDTFASGTTEGWVTGIGPNQGMHPAPPVVVPDGGPAGVGDAYLRLTSVGGDGPGSRLVAVNATQWAGDYEAAGVAGIEADLLNLGPADLQIRLYLADPTLAPFPLPPANTAVTTASVIVPAGAGWISFRFPIGAAAFELTGLTGDVPTLLSGVTVLRIFHAPTASYPGPQLVAQLGVDNLRAVPEPAAAPLAAAALAPILLACARRRRLPRAGRRRTV